jgi:DNA-binding LacI/PurR family transcriptional regulator
MLTQRETMTIGLLTPQALTVIFSNPFFALFSEGVADAAEGAGYELQFISPLNGSLALAMGRTTVDGVVAIGLSANHPEVEQVRRSGLPMVLVDADDVPGHSSVVVDDIAGAREAAEHLIGLGHRDVLIIAVERAQSVNGKDRITGVAERRLAGYQAAFEAVGSARPAEWIVAERASIEGGAAAFREAWARGLRPTAVLAMSDATAIGAMSAARELGVRVPRDLSVVGFDDIDLAGHLDPPLTTVHQPIRQKGAEAVRLLLAEVEQRDDDRPHHRRLETRLIVRGSTGPSPQPRQEVNGAN